MGIGIAGAMNLEKFEDMAMGFFANFSLLIIAVIVVALFVPGIMIITKKIKICQLWSAVSILCVLSLFEAYIIVQMSTLVVASLFFGAICILYLFAFSAITGYLLWDSIENLIPGKNFQERNCL